MSFAAESHKSQLPTKRSLDQEAGYQSFIVPSSTGCGCDEGCDNFKLLYVSIIPQIEVKLNTVSLSFFFAMALATAREFPVPEK